MGQITRGEPAFLGWPVPMVVCDSTTNDARPVRFRTVARWVTGARSGILETLHGPVETPAFMPVGTQATVKGLTPEQIRATGTVMLLANTYHLALRPGEDEVAGLGGLHSFMGWDGPILTDSGGFQVFSLSDRSRVTDHGVAFRSHLDGESSRADARASDRDPGEAGGGHGDVPGPVPGVCLPRRRKLPAAVTPDDRAGPRRCKASRTAS